MKVTREKVWTPVTIKLQDPSEQEQLEGILDYTLKNTYDVPYLVRLFARVLLAELQGRRESVSSEKPGPTIGKW